MAIDPTFAILRGKKEKISSSDALDMILPFSPPPPLGNVLPFEHFNYDNYPQPFVTGGLVSANIDAIFNISLLWDGPQLRFSTDDGLLILDLTKGPKGMSEYYLWRNTSHYVVVDETIITNTFRKDISLSGRIEKVNLYDDVFGETSFDLVDRVRKLKRKFGIVGSTDPPGNLKDFIIKLCIALENSDIGTWIIFSVPDDVRIEFLEAPHYAELFGFKTIIRTVSSIYPWFVAQVNEPIKIDVKKLYESLMEYPELKSDGDIPGLPIEKDFFNLKLISMHWKIPSSA